MAMVAVIRDSGLLCCMRRGKSCCSDFNKMGLMGNSGDSKELWRGKTRAHVTNTRKSKLLLLPFISSKCPESPSNKYEVTVYIYDIPLLAVDK